MLNQDFKEFIQLLNAHEVRYLIVGGYAVAIHGHPRYTKDIDVWVAADSDNADRLLRVLDEFGFGSLDIVADDFVRPNHVIQLGYPPARIDLLTSVSGVDFDSCYAARLNVEVDNMLLNVIDLKNLRRNKQASGRFQDLADLENLGGDDVVI